MKSISLIVLAVVLSLPGALLAQQQDKTWTVNFKDSDIHEVIKFVADATGKTVIIDPRVKGKVKVISADPLNKDDLYSLFLSVLEIQGFTAVESGEIVRVIPKKEARSSPSAVSESVNRLDDEYTTQVISLQNVSASRVLPVLRPLVPQQSHLAAYEPGNAIIIADTGANIARIRSLIQKIDRAAVEGTDVVELKYAQAADIVRIIDELHPQGSGGNNQRPWLLVSDERTNSVLIKGPDIEREKIQTLIVRMDRPGPQSGNVRVVYLNYADAESLAQVLSNIVQNAQQADNQSNNSNVRASVEADVETNALLITAEGDTLKTLLSVVERLDIRRAQVLVEAIIVEINERAGRDLGIQWLFRDGENGAFGSSSDAPSSTSLGAVSAAALGGDSTDGDGEVTTTALQNLGAALSGIPGNTLGFGRIDDNLSFSVLLNALQSSTDANILSTPNLLTLDNNAASITVGENVPFVTGSFTNTGGNNGANNPFQTIQRESVGITLEVTPRINEGDAVILDIVQEVSSLDGVTSGVGASDIITTERRIQTQVLADDGETIVLGGLMADDVQEFKRKVPVLGSIPLLGKLFRSTSTTIDKNNLLVFIRATVIRDPKAMSGATAEKYRHIRDQQLARKKQGVTWFDGEKLPVLPSWEELQQQIEQREADAQQDESVDEPTGEPSDDQSAVNGQGDPVSRLYRSID